MVSDPWRILFGICLLISWGNSVHVYLTRDRMTYSHRGGHQTVLPKHQTRMVWLLTLPFVAAVIAFVMQYQIMLAGIACLVFMLAIRRLEIAQWPKGVVLNLGKYVPTAAALLGYLVARVLTIGEPEAVRDAAGWDMACGIMAATYMLAALAKWRSAGPAWLQSKNTALLVAERSYTGIAVLARLRRRVARSRLMCGVAGNYGFWIEAFGFLFIFEWARWAYTAATSAMQFGIMILLGYIEAEWLLVMVALTGLSV